MVSGLPGSTDDRSLGLPEKIRERWSETLGRDARTDVETVKEKREVS